MGRTTPRGDSVSSVSGKAFPGRVSVSNLPSSMSVKARRGASVCMCALSWHLPTDSRVIRCNLASSRSYNGLELFSPVHLGDDTVGSLENRQLTVQFNSFFAGPKQAAPSVSLAGALHGDSPHPCPSRECECRAALIFHPGNDARILPWPAPPSASVGYFIHALPSFHPGVLFSSLDVNPRRVGAVWGWRGGGVSMKTRTQPKYSGTLPGAALIKKGTD